MAFNVVVKIQLFSILARRPSGYQREGPGSSHTVGLELHTYSKLRVTRCHKCPQLLRATTANSGFVCHDVYNCASEPKEKQEEGCLALPRKASESIAHLPSRREAQTVNLSWVLLRWHLVWAGVQPRGGAAGGPALGPQGLIPRLPSLLTPETPSEAVLCLSLPACSQLLVLLLGRFLSFFFQTFY